MAIIHKYTHKLKIHISNKTKITNLEIDNFVSHDEAIDLGFEKIQCLHTPGHYYDSICFWNQSSKSIFTGDTMFIGRTGRVLSSKSSIDDLYDSIYNILLKLPHETIIYPGHDYGYKLSDTIQNNIISSSFFNCKNLD